MIGIFLGIMYDISSLIVVEDIPDISLSEFLYKADVVLAVVVFVVNMIEEGGHNE